MKCPLTELAFIPDPFLPQPLDPSLLSLPHSCCLKRNVMAGALAAILDHEVTSYTGGWQCNELEGVQVPHILWCTVAIPASDFLCRNAYLFTTLLFGAFCNSQPTLTKADSALSPGLSLPEVEKAKAGQLVCSQGGLRAWCLLGARVRV